MKELSNELIAILESGHINSKEEYDVFAANADERFDDFDFAITDLRIKVKHGFCEIYKDEYVQDIRYYLDAKTIDNLGYDAPATVGWAHLKTYTNNGYDFHIGDIIEEHELYDKLSEDFHDKISCFDMVVNEWLVDDIYMSYKFFNDDIIITDIDENVEQYMPH